MAKMVKARRKDSMDAEEKKWRAEQDVSSLRRYNEIQNDPERLRMAEEIIDKEEQGLKAARSVLGKKRRTK